MDNKEIIYVKDIPKGIKKGTVLNIENQEVTYLMHGFHKYPGKFIPQIPRWAIEKYAPNSEATVIDPFCGSGTTIVESLVLGYNSVGIDIDPLSCLMSKVKSTPLNPIYFENILRWVNQNIDLEEKIFKPETKNIDHWFTQEAQIKLGKIRTSIEKVKIQFQHIDNILDYYDCLIILFSSIIRRVSNADNQSQKTYVSGTKPKQPAEVYSLFRRQSDLYVERFYQLFNMWDKKSKSKIIQSDGGARIDLVLKDKIDLAVTSPPYIKSIDYVYNQMVELFWIGDLFNNDTQEKQNKQRREYVGTTLVYKKEYKEFDESSVTLPIISNTIESILSDSRNGQKHAYIVDEYFNFMSNHLEAMFNILNNGSYYVMVVGNSTVSDVLVSTSDIIIELALLAGFVLENRWSYEIKNHFMGFNRSGRGGKIKEDHVLVFQKK